MTKWFWKVSWTLELVVSVTGLIRFIASVEGVRESEVIKQAIALAQIDNSDPDYMLQVLTNLMICIRHGNCELPIKSFK
jgi:hypothetical protein